MCTPDKTTMHRCRSITVGLLVMLLVILTSWWCPVHQLSEVRGCDKLKRTFSKCVYYSTVKSGQACVFMQREEWDYYTRSCVYLSFFSRSICKHLRASLNYAAEPIFASLLWCKGFDCSQLAKNDSSLGTAKYCLVCIEVRTADFWAEVCYHFWLRQCSNFSSFLPMHLSCSQHKHLYSKGFYSF